MRWMHDAGRSLVGAVAVAGAMSLAGEAGATVSQTLLADTYIIVDGSRTYSVLDIYVSGNNLGDGIGSVSGLNGTSGWSVVFATSRAEGDGLVRDVNGKISSGTISRDIFVQAGNSSWNPTYGGPEAWDSFIAIGNRKQNASVTNRAGILKTLSYETWVGFSQMNVPNSNFINNGGSSYWVNNMITASTGYSSTASAEVPFSRLSLYNSYWNLTYPDLDRAGVLVSKGKLQRGRSVASGMPDYKADTGASLDYCLMLGRFAIDVTGNDPSELITMNAQFNMVGKNGLGAETGTTFTGATTAAYKVSQFFSFAMPCPSDLDLNGLVDTADISLLLLDFGPCAGCPSDLDGSGTTDTADVSLLLLEFGAC